MEKIIPEWNVQTRFCPNKEHAEAVALETLANKPLNCALYPMKHGAWLVVATFQVKPN